MWQPLRENFTLDWLDVISYILWTVIIVGAIYKLGWKGTFTPERVLFYVSFFLIAVYVTQWYILFPAFWAISFVYFRYCDQRRKHEQQLEHDRIQAEKKEAALAILQKQKEERDD